jgi:hypothetical protein
VIPNESDKGMRAPRRGMHVENSRVNEDEVVEADNDSTISIDISGQAGQADQVTVLRTHGPLATKHVRLNTVESAQQYIHGVR